MSGSGRDGGLADGGRVEDVVFPGLEGGPEHMNLHS